MESICHRNQKEDIQDKEKGKEELVYRLQLQNRINVQIAVNSTWPTMFVRAAATIKANRLLLKKRRNQKKKNNEEPSGPAT